jgi:hypothetical protein
MMKLTSVPPADRQALLSLTPQVYLARGFRRPDGAAWPELSTTWSLAAAEQLRASGVTPAQLERTFRPVVQRALSGRSQPLALTQAAMMGLLGDASIPKSVCSLLQTCISSLRSSEDLEPMAEHLASVLQLLSLKSALSPTTLR